MIETPNAIIWDRIVEGTEGDPTLDARRFVRCLRCDSFVASHPFHGAEGLETHPEATGDALVRHFAQYHPGTAIDAVGAGLSHEQGAPRSRVWGTSPIDASQVTKGDVDAQYAEPPAKGSESVVTLAKDALSIIQRLSIALRTPEAMYDHTVEAYRSAQSDANMAETSLMDLLDTFYSHGRMFT